MATSGYPPPVKAGDRVRLPSGGAVMTVERVFDWVENPFVRCVWMDAWSRVSRGPFDLAAVELAPEKPDPSSEALAKEDTS